MIKLLKRLVMKIEKLSEHVVGLTDGDHCNRGLCIGIIQREEGSCCCNTCGNPPCWYCTSSRQVIIILGCLGILQLIKQKGFGNMKIMYFDVETSGTDEKVNAVLQLAGTIHCEGLKAFSFNYFMKPFPGQVIEDEALEANGFTRGQIEIFADPVKCYVQFVRMLTRYVDRFDKSDKITLVGYNSGFDDGFLRQWFKNCYDSYYGSYFFWPAIDVANMAAVRYRKTRSQFPDFKLMTVAKYLGIRVDESKAHDAVYDTEITKELYELCLGSDN